MTEHPETLSAIVSQMRNRARRGTMAASLAPELDPETSKLLRHYADRIEAAAPAVRGDFGNDIAPDGRTVGVYVGTVTATHTFATADDARAADGLIDFLSTALEGATIVSGGDRWPSGKRPADIPLAPPLAVAFANLSPATGEALGQTAALPAAGTPEQPATSSHGENATPPMPAPRGGNDSTAPEPQGAKPKPTAVTAGETAPFSAPARNCDGGRRHEMKPRKMGKSKCRWCAPWCDYETGEKGYFCELESWSESTACRPGWCPDYRRPSKTHPATSLVWFGDKEGASHA